MEIYYCDSCQLKVLDSELAGGQAVRVGQSVFCGKCASAKGLATGRKTAGPRPKTVTAAKPIPAPKKSAGNNSGLNLNIVLGSLGVLMIGAALWLLFGGSSSSERAAPVTDQAAPSPPPVASHAPVGTNPVAPPVPKTSDSGKEQPTQAPVPPNRVETITAGGDIRETLATGRLRQIQDEWKASPNDPWKYSDALQEVISRYGGSNAAADAKKLRDQIDFKSSLEHPLARWTLDNSAGARSVVLTGGASWVAGRSTTVLNLPADKASYADLGAAPELNFAPGAPFTFAVWVKTHDANGPIVSFRNNKSDAAVIDLTVGCDGPDNNPGQVMALLRSDQNNDLTHIVGTTVNDDRWHHVAITRSRDGTLSLYLDGKTQGSSAAKCANAITTDMRAVGAERYWMRVNAPESDKAYLSGQFSDLRVYPGALRGIDIEELAKQ